ncbi:MAG TPA: head completion protein [Chromatiaceae bacterium]|nr:head completion protein [Chromatiaceae bacterium]
MAYKGKWKPKNLEKYEGNPFNITYRSLWERKAFKWCDENPKVRSWSSEEIVIPYILKTDGKRHRYYPDLKITYTDGRTALIEIKPKRQTRPPKIKARKGPKYIKEVYAYGMNTSKWEYAKEYAKDRGWVFEIWTEDELKEKGIRIINSSKKYK